MLLWGFIWLSDIIPRGLRRGSATARLLGLRIRIPMKAWLCISFEYCVLSGRGLCVRLIACPEEPYQTNVVCSCDSEEALVD